MTGAPTVLRRPIPRSSAIGLPALTLALLGFAWAPRAAAQAVSPVQSELSALSLEQLLDVEIQAASKFPLRLSDSPSAATVITAAQIRALGYRSLADVLRSVRGVSVASDRTYAYLGVRGYSAPGDYNTRILLLIDGNRVNDTVYDQAFLGTEFPLDLDLVDRVEFVPGQGSSVHGPNALFGVVNVITRAPPPAGATELALSAGSGRARLGRITRHWALGDDRSLTLSATAGRSDGRDPFFPAFDAPSTGNGISRDTDYDDAESIYARFGGGPLTATLIHADRRKGLSGETGLVFGDPRNQYRDVQTLVNIAWSQPLGPDAQWTLRSYAGDYAFRGTYVVDYPPVSVNVDRVKSTWWGVESIVQTSAFDDHHVVVGLDAQFSPRRMQVNRDVAPDEFTYLDDSRRGKRLSLFVEDHWKLAPWLAVLTGGRLDRIDSFGSRFSHRFALVGQATDDLTFKLIQGSAFRQANAYEAHYDLGAVGGYKGNPGLRAERVRGTELVAEYRPSALTRWTASAFSNRAGDLITQGVDPADELLVFSNTGAFRTHGVELEFQHSWIDGADLRINYSQQRVSDPSAWGNDMRSPRRMVKAVGSCPLAPGWTLAGELLLTGRRGDLAGSGLTNVTLSSSALLRSALVSLAVYDVFDRQPVDVGTGSILQTASPQDGRSFRLKVEWAW